MITLYGATGYMGELIAREAARAGLPLTLAGRNAGALQAIAAQTGQPTLTFGLEDVQTAAQALRSVGTRVLLNAGGPFHQTIPTLVPAALEAGAHVLDLAGEVEDFQVTQGYTTQALAAGLMLLPGVGFGVVPTDSLAVHLKTRLPDATHLKVAFYTQGGVSRGTAQTVLRGLQAGGVRREGGELRPTPAAWRELDVDFGAGGSHRVLFNPWRADLLSAAQSTGIANVETYSHIPAPLAGILRLDRRLPTLVRSRAVQTVLGRQVRGSPRGPSDEERAEGHSHVWGEVRNARGETRRALLHGPEAYDFSAQTAVMAARRVLAGQVKPGYRTPAEVFGPDAVLEVPGVSRIDL